MGKRAALLAVGVALAALVVAGWQLHRLRERARSEVARVLGSAFDAQATVREVGVDLTTGGLTLRGVEVKRGGRTLLSAARVRAMPSLAALLRGEVELQRVSIPTASIRLRLDDLSALSRDGELGLPNIVEIDALDLGLDLKPRGALALAGATLSLIATNGGLESFALSSSSAAWRSDQETTTANALTLNGRRQAREWQLDADAAVDEGSIRAEANVRGTFAPLRLAGRTRVAGASQLEASSAVILDASGVRLDSLRLSTGSSQFTGRATLGWLASHPARHVVRADVALESAAVGGSELGQLTAEVTFNFSRSADATVQLARLPLRELYRLLGAAEDPVLTRLQGNSAGTAELKYRSAGPSALDVSLALQLSDVDLAGYAFDRGRVSAQVSIPDRALGLRGGALRLGELSLGAASGKLELSGTMVRGAVDMLLRARGLPLERSPWVRGTTRTVLTGRIDGQGTFRGDASSILGDLQLSVADLRLLGEPLGQIQVQALLRPTTATSGAQLCPASRSALTSNAFRGASAWLFCGGGWNDRLRIDLALGNGAALPIRGEVSIADFAVAPVVRALQPSAADAIGPGTLSATLALEDGGLAAPEQLSGALRVRKLTLGSGDGRLESAAPFELRARAGALSLDGAKLDGPVQHYAISAAGSLGKTARLIADGQIAASTFTRDSEPVVKAFGDIGVHLEWTPGGNDVLRGYAELRDLALRLPAALDARRLRGRLRLAGPRLQLEGVEAEVGGGKVGIAGHLDIAGVRVVAYDLRIEAQRVALEPAPLVRLELDAHTQLAWRGATQLPALSGSLIVRQLAYGKPLHLEALSAMNRTRPGAAARDRVTLDLTVEQRAPLRVRNMLLDGELAIAGADRRLRIVGTDQRLGVLGALSVTRGRILFQGDQFHFTRGDITLRDPARVAPHFDVRAVADQPRRKDTSVVLTAQGTRDAFKVAVQCEAGEAAIEAPPFTCNYAHDRIVCDDFDRLVAQWSCPIKHAAKASSVTR